MNGKVVALAAFALLTTSLLAWLLLSDPPEVDVDYDDEELVEEQEEQPQRTAARRVLKENDQPDERAAEPAQEMNLPGALPRLKIKEHPPVSAETGPAEPVEPAPTVGATSSRAEEDSIVAEKAINAGVRCLHETRSRFPEARGEMMARLHLGAGPGGQTVVRNLEIDSVGEVHPELLSCLDRALMELNLELPEGIARVVNAPLRLLGEGEAGMPAAGTVYPRPEYAPQTPPVERGMPTGTAAGSGGMPPHELPPGVVTEDHLPSGEPASPPPEHQMPPPQDEPPPEGLPPAAVPEEGQ